jgi:hypothetical protein
MYNAMGRQTQKYRVAVTARLLVRGRIKSAGTGTKRKKTEQNE